MGEKNVIEKDVKGIRGNFKDWNEMTSFLYILI